MKETTKRPWIVSAAVFCGLGLSIFVVGAVMGYALLEFSVLFAESVGKHRSM